MIQVHCQIPEVGLSQDHREVKCIHGEELQERLGFVYNSCWNITLRNVKADLPNNALSLILHACWLQVINKKIQYSHTRWADHLTPSDKILVKRLKSLVIDGRRRNMYIHLSQCLDSFLPAEKAGFSKE